MNITALTALLTPCLPWLLKVTEGVCGAIGEDAWNKAKQIWEKLSPKLEAKEDARIAAEQVAAKPESQARQAVFQEELEALLKENPDLAAAIAQIMEEDTSEAAGIQIRAEAVEGQVIGQMIGSKAIGRIDSLQGNVSL